MVSLKEINQYITSGAEKVFIEWERSNKTEPGPMGYAQIDYRDNRNITFSVEGVTRSFCLIDCKKWIILRHVHISTVHLPPLCQ